MTISLFAQARYHLPVRLPRLGRIIGCVLSILLFAAVSHPVGAQITVSNGSLPALAPGPRIRLDQQFKRRLPAASKAMIDRAEQAFLEHLRRTSGLASEQLATGRIDDEDLSARIDVFLGDHPEFAGTQSVNPTGDPRARVVEELGRDPDLARTDAERKALADRFIVWLGGLSGTARDNLLAGRLAPDELRSRIEVFSADIRAERAKVVSDPAVAAVPAIEEAFEKANLGPVPERADSICCKGTESDGKIARDFVLFKKRPESIRIHIVEDGMVAGVLAYDGVTAWRQVPGRMPVRLTGAEAESLISSSRFDDPLVGYRERGAAARLESAPGASPIRLRIREAGGREVVETIDPATYNELSVGWRNSAGKWDETRFREYRKVGPVSVAGVQEHWSDGALLTTTRISEVRLDSGVLARIFSFPSNPNLDYMDFMGGLKGLAMIVKREAAATQPPTAGPSK
jgi:hypothetical protein